MDYFSFSFFIYFLRWILSGFLMLIPLYFLIKYNCCYNKYQEYIHIIILQAIGAFFFYPIDNFIFNS